jgi:CubicO group peptidase (beta-lactamase class C family)
MSHRRMNAAPRLSRRGALGLLGAASVAAGAGMLATSSPADAKNAARPPGWNGPIPPALRPGGEFDQFVQQQAAQGLFSGNVLLGYRGRPELVRSTGMADQELSVPNTLNTLFTLASVTKSMTATAVVQLAEQGKLALWETLGTYLDGFPAQAAGNVTVHNLLTMTSGMSDYSQGTTWLQQIPSWTTADEVLDGTIAIIKDQGLLFAPGTAYSYSNSGFVVLGAIVQQVSGQPYWDYMREHIFAPAGMTRTDFYTWPRVLSLDAKHQVAHPYGSQHNGGSDVDDFGDVKLYIGLPDGSGGPYTTTLDLLSFATALQDGTLLSPGWAELMLNGKFPVSTPANPSLPWQSWVIGYGLEDTMINGQHILGHSGNGPGITTGIDIYPQLGWVAVILGNCTLEPFGVSTEMSQIADLERRLITGQAAEAR